MKNELVFKTKDLISATYIACNGIKFAGGYEPESMSWVFSEPDRCSELDLQLRNGESNVEVTKYESTRRTLLGMVPSKR
jgi:hypothetical protein